MTLLVDVAEATVFGTTARAWTWADVFLAVRLWGEWDALLAATRDASASPEAVTAAGRAWRRDKRLIAGDDLKAWLAARRLAVADWNAYLRRAIGEREPGAAPAPAELWPEGVCSGVWDRASERLSTRAAAWQAAGTPAPTRPPPSDWFARMPGAPEAAEIGLDRASVARSSEDIWAAEEAFESLRAAAAAPDAVAGVVAAHNVDWLRVDCEWLEAGDQDVAREAALVARVDGVGLADVARRAGLTMEPRRIYVGDVDAGLQTTLMSAAPGDLVGPLAIGDNGSRRWMVAAVTAKVAPTLEDPDIRARAEEAAVAAAVRRAVDEHVRWHEQH